MSTLHVDCCIAGGGPAGLMLGYLLARAGVGVAVLEKHADFLRDFRGDTIHPSTLDVIAELGLLDAFLALPHDEVTELTGQVYGQPVTLADFRHLPTRCKRLVLMPQWDFLDFLAAQAGRYAGFRLLTRHEVTALREADGRITGVRARGPDGEVDIDADLVVGADGRHSVVRRCAALPLVDLGAPIDVLWFSLPRDANDQANTGGYIEPGFFFVTLNRGTYWQCAYVIPKGARDAVRAQGIARLRARIADVVPFLADNVAALTDFDQLKLLEVQVNHLTRWHRPGLLCIGDAAHAMSPVGGVGINLAIQDAVATANRLARPLREHRLTEGDLAAVQRRRAWPARITQRVQVAVQERVVARVVAGAPLERPPVVPWPVRMLQRHPWLRRIPARLVGVGARPEHVRIAEA